MIETLVIRPAVRARLRRGLLGSAWEGVAQALHDHGYGPTTIRAYLRTGVRFGEWIAQQRIPVAEISDATVAQYLQHCGRLPSGRLPKAARGLPRLMRLLRAHGVIGPEPVPAQTNCDCWLQRYAHYLRTVKGAAESTCDTYLRGARRLSIVRRFLTFVRAHAPETEVPDHHLVASARRRAPYLFTAEQLTALLHAARQAGPQESLRPHTLATLVGVLASTGLRSGEALQLEVSDVQLNGDPPRLLIAPAKFQKARWLPLHATTVTQLRQYLQLRQQYVPQPTTTVFFLSASGRPVRHAALLSWFSHTCRRLGFQPTAGMRRPCLHSLRHTFAVRRVVAWNDAGFDVHERLPHLSVYLGHVHPRESYWYLTATPELLRQAARRFARYARPGGEA